ncbi:hypothetical protein H4R18_005030 [Coemansia javaensis]|uniref:UDP-glucose 6-dehydrogenase n=1 Tax=Coemansia javaensis TaxID=2761396 RepID=A0A9W8LFG1_9FUNG|nr:hypothetical protein H4R18_005030 [Coemansia javaensis]
MTAASVRRVCCIGAGYVGGPTSAVMALKCPGIQFTVVDSDAGRIAAWNSAAALPIYEPGLDEVVRSQRGRNLWFSTDIDAAVAAADIVLLAVNTPLGPRGAGLGGATDLSAIEQCARTVARVARRPTIVVEKSTVPCGTGELIAGILRRDGRPGVGFSVLSNPEFLSEGTAVRDLLRPDRVIIGGLDGSEDAQRALASVYAHWVPQERIVTMGLWSAELAKLAANALLAQRVSSINSISAVCEAVGADIADVSRACGMDSRIGGRFLHASVGFGGSCFHKDIMGLVWLAESLGLHDVAEYWDQVLQMNSSQTARFVARIARAVGCDLDAGAEVAVLGFAYKAGTGDTRNTPAAPVCERLLAQGARLAIYDPKVPARQIRDALPAESHYHHRVRICSDAYEAVAGARAVVLLTPWPEFATLDWARVHGLMAQPAYVFDGHRALDAPALDRLGFRAVSVGVRTTHHPKLK